MNSIASDIYDGFYELVDCLSAPIGFILSILIGAFIAIRVFYIQKRHERMADKYEEVFTGLRVIINYCKSLNAEPSTVPSRPISESEEYQNFAYLVEASRIYFNAEVEQVLEKLDDPPPIPPDVGSNSENLRAYVQSFVEFHESILEQLVNQAKNDLRPNLWQFTKEFFTTFFCG
jgi:hypothetical protein